MTSSSAAWCAALEQVVAVAVLGVGVDAEVHAAAQRRRARRTIGTSWSRLSSLMTVLKRMLSMPRARIPSTAAKILAESPGMPRARVVPAVEVVERDVELMDPRVPERRAARSGVSMPPWVMSVTYLSRDRPIHRGDDLLEIAAQQRLATGEGDEHRIEEARRVGEALELVRRAVRRRLPVVAEPAVRVAAKRDLEVHEHRPLARTDHAYFPRNSGTCHGLKRRRQHATAIHRKHDARALRRWRARTRSPHRRGARRRCRDRW